MRRPLPRRVLVQSGLLVLVVAVVFGTVSADDEKKAPAKKEANGQAKADDGEKKDDEKKDGPAMENPFGRLIGRLLTPPEGRMLPEAKPDMERDLDRRDRARDNIDLRAPQKLAQTKRLRTAERLIEEGNHEGAYEYLEAILGLRDATLAPPEDSLVRSEDGQWVSLRWETNRLIGTLPAEILEQHRLAHGPEAEARLERARNEHDLAAIAEVAMRYFQTASGQRAANLLASLHFERGEYGLAARWYARLLDARAPFTETSAWRLRAVLAFTRSSQPDRAEPLIAALRNDGALDRMLVGGEPLDFPEWLTAIREDAGYGHVPSIRNWPAPYGTPQRVAKHVGSRPLLVPRWNVVDAAVEDASRPIGRQLEWLMLDLRDSGSPAIPSIQPIAVDGRIAYRTLGGVNVIDARTGRRLWETDRGVSPLVMLGAEAAEGTSGIRTHVNRYQGHNADNHALTNLLVRNGLWGTITSDGDRLFVIEDQAVMIGNEGYYGRWGRRVNVGFKSIGTKTLDFASNRLTAYNLESGRPIWSVGGPRSDEPFAPPLEGTYFFGTPITDGGELFAVGERNDEIRLISIDPATGGRNWSQLIALTDVDIDEDTFRRQFSAQVAVGEGIIVCPTTVGWLVAVDRLNHTVLWAQRYSPAPAGDAPSEVVEELNMTQHRMLGQRWAASAPIVAGNRVIYAPEEEAALYCFDLFDGHELWERTMQGHLYVAGVFDDHVLLVGRDHIEALSLSNGRRAWAIGVEETATADIAPTAEPFPRVGPAPAVPPMPMPMDHHDHTHSDSPFPTTNAARVLPSGRGVMIGEQFFLPMTNGELWTIDLAKGEVVERSFLPEGDRPLGNLVVHRDGLYSASAFGLRAFEPRTAFEQTLAAGNDDAASNLKRAELHFLGHAYDRALEVLRATPLEEVPEAVREPYRQALIRALVEVVRRTPDSNVDVEQLQSIARTNAEKLAFRHLIAERFEALGRHDEAFVAYLELVDRIDDDELYHPGGDLSVRSGTWVATRLADNWSQLDGNVRERLTPMIAERAQKALAGFVDEQRRFSDLFAFHPSAVAVEQKYVAAIAETEPFAVVENRLHARLLRSDDPDVVSAARERLAAMEREVEMPPADANVGPDWGDVDVEVVQTKDYSSNEAAYPVDPLPGQSPFLRTHRFVIHQQQNHFSGGYQVRRLEIVDARDGSRFWMPALRADDNGGNANVSVCRTADNLVFLAYMDVLTVLSPVDRRIVWTRRLGNNQQLSSFYRHVQRDDSAAVAMQYGPQITGSNGVVARGNRSGLLAVANADYVCVHGRRKLSVHDAATGRLRWELDEVPIGTQVYGNEDVLIVNANGRTTARRPSDGGIVENDELVEYAPRALEFDEDGLVLVENRAGGGLLGLTGVKAVVRRWDPNTHEDRWSVEYTRNTGFVRLRDGSLLGMGPEGEVSLLDLRTGQRTELGKVPAELIRSRGQIHALSDANRVYLAIESRGNRANRMTDDDIPHVRFNGTMVAFDRETGVIAWQREIEQQSLLLPGFEDSPFVVFASRRYVNKPGFSYWMSYRLVLDKKTGRVLHDGTAGSNNGYQSMTIDIARRFVELRAYDGRTIFRAVPHEASTDADGNAEPAAEGAKATSTEEVRTELELPERANERPAANALAPVVEEIEVLEVPEEVQVIGPR